MKPTFSDLTPEQQATFGNGCTFVPDFNHQAKCSIHDFVYCRGYSLSDKIKGDWDMCRLMLVGNIYVHEFVLSLFIAPIYWLGLTFLPFSYFFFEWGNRYRTIKEIVEYDAQKKGKFVL